MTGQDMLLQHKANYFFKNSIAIHVEYKTGNWKNGYILSVGANFFMLNEFKEGELPVFYLEVEKIERFTEKEEQGDVY